MTTPEKHQLRIARKTMQLSCVFCRILGGPNHLEAVEIIARLTGKLAKKEIIGEIVIRLDDDGVVKEVTRLEHTGDYIPQAYKVEQWDDDTGEWVTISRGTSWVFP